MGNRGMETTVRGLLEKEIDELITPITLEKLIMMFQKIFPTKSMEDCLFGFIVGAIFTRALTIITIGENRELNNAETKELVELLERRTMEIKGKIKLTLGK